MKVTYRIPGIDAFSYIEIEKEVDNKVVSPEAIVDDFNTYLAAYKGGDGLPKKEFEALLDGYLRDGVYDDEYNKCNPQQKENIQMIKRSLNRIKYHGNGDNHEDQ